MCIRDRVNSERKKLAIPELVWDSNLVPVARAHAKDMWERKYFSHYSPEGKDAVSYTHLTLPTSDLV